MLKHIYSEEININTTQKSRRMVQIQFDKIKLSTNKQIKEQIHFIVKNIKYLYIMNFDSIGIQNSIITNKKYIL